MGSMKQTRYYVPCKECKGTKFLSHHSFYWTHDDDDTDALCIAMMILTCTTCNLTTYYAQEQDVLEALQSPSPDICN